MKELKEQYKSYKDGEGKKPVYATTASIKYVGDAYRSILSKEVTDRDGEIVDIDGLDITNYLANPILVDAHNSNGSVVDNLIGKMNNIEKTTIDGVKQLSGSIEFAPTERGQKAKQLVDGGFATTLSIGFGVNEYDYKASRILESELYETSLVMVPSNVGSKITKALEAYSDIHPKIKQYRKLFMSKEITEPLGYEKTGDELTDIKNIYDLLVKKTTKRVSSDKQENLAKPTIKKNSLTVEMIAEMVKNTVLEAK